MQEAEANAAHKKRKRRKDDRPGEIIAAGLVEFGENGFAATRLDDVARRADIAKGTIYRYFDSKQALFEAAVRSRLTIALDSAAGMIAAWPGPTPDLIRMLLRFIYARMQEPQTGTILRIVIGEGARFPAITEFYHREMIAKGRALLRAILERGVARGEFRQAAAIDAPIVLIAPVLAAMVWQMNFERHEALSLDAFFEAHVDTVLNGLMKR